VAGGAEDDVDCVAFRSGEVVSFQEAVVLHVADDRLDPVSSSHLAPDRRRGDAAGVAERDVEIFAFDAVAAVAAIGVRAPDPASGEAGDLVDLSRQSMAVVGSAWQCHGTKYELPALAALVGGRDRRLHAELVAGRP